MKNIFIWLLLIVFASTSCRNQQSDSKTNHVQQKTNTKILGVDELTLTHLPSDTTEVHIELGMPSGDYTMFYFKNVPKSINNPTEKIRGLFVEVKQIENKSTPAAYFDSLNTVNYHSYAFEISKENWDSIKKKADEIELAADTAYKNFYCEFCPHYTLGYNNKMIANKLTKDKQVEKFFNYLIDKYRKKLYTSTKK